MSKNPSTSNPKILMKSPTRILSALLLSAFAMALSSCATTGDPSTGGIFWSESKAQDRLAQRQYHLENIERETNATNRQSAQTKHRIDELR